MPRRLVLLALVVLLPRPALFAQEPDSGVELEPSLGLYSWVEAPDPYDLVLRDALLGPHRYRKCQLVAIPSFEREWAIYVVRNQQSAPQLIVRSMRRQLWHQMMRVLSGDGTKTSYSIGAKAQEAALSKVKIDIDTWAQPLSENDADLLEDVWWRLLGRVRYSDATRGEDGVIYHVSHWATGIGFRSGKTWSPGDGTRPAALVQLAKDLRDFAETKDQRSLGSARAEAQDLLERLK